jgi:WD40 repeat protein
VQLDIDNPWPGLESFEENAHTFFYGRSGEAASLLNQVLDAPAVVLYGRSGLGKTSLLQAGLFPLLRERGFLPVYVRLDLKPGVTPLTDQLRQSVRDSIRADVPDATLPADDESLWEYLHRKDFEIWSARNYPLTPVIVLDQFEELFTLGERVAGRVTDFRNHLGDLVENRIPADLAARIEHDEAIAARFHLRSGNYKILISLREDFLPDLEGWRRLIPALGRSRMRLLPLRADDALDAVRKPAADLMTDALARQVVRIIAGDDTHGHTSAWDGVDHSGEQVGPLDVEPALLSLFCRELNEERKRRGKPSFDEQLVEDGRRNTLSNYYSSCVGDLPPPVAHFIESELITEKGFRNSYAREDAVPSRLTDDELARLIRARLLRLEERHGAQRIELTHDVLTSVVREHRDRRRAQDAAESAATAEAERRVARERRRRSRLLQAVVALTVLIAVLATVAAFIAVVQEHRAISEARNALAAELETDASAVFSRVSAGSDIRAIADTLAAQRLRSDAGASPGAFYTATAALNTTRVIVPTPAPVTSVAANSTGHILASCGSDHTIRLWNLDGSGRPVPAGPPLQGHSDGVESLAFSPDGRILASGSLDDTVRLWNLTDPAHPLPLGGPLTGHTDAVSSVAFSPDGRILASGSLDDTVRLWNLTDPAHPLPLGAPLTGHTDAVRGVAFSPDGHTVASAGADQTVQLWNLADPVNPVPLDPISETGAVWSVAFSPDGRTLASGGADNAVLLWDFSDPAHPGAPVGQLDGSAKTTRTGPTNTVTSVVFSPDGHTLASASTDQTVRLWDVSDPSQAVSLGGPLTGHTNTVSGAAFSPDGRTLLSGSLDTTVRLWNLDTVLSSAPPGGSVQSVAVSPDGRILASAGADNTVRLWNLADPGHPRPLGQPLTGHTDMVTCVAFSPDGHILASGSADHTVRLWNLTDTAQATPLGSPPLIGHTAAVNSVAFSPDGHLLASGGEDDSIRLWDLTDAANTRTIGQPMLGRAGAVWGVAFSAHGRTLASGGTDGTVRLWDVTHPVDPVPLGRPLTGRTGTGSTGPTNTVTSVAFSPDGRMLASGGLDSTVRLWEVTDPSHPSPLGRPLIGHTGAVLTVAFGPDGQTLASGSSDTTVRLWDVADSAQHPFPLGQPLQGHTAAVRSVAFSPDGHTLVSGGGDGTLQLWPTPQDATVATLCSKLTANISREQWSDWISPSIGYMTLCPQLPVPAA